MGPFQTRKEAEISLDKYLKHGENMIFNQIWNMQHELNKVIGKDTILAKNKEEWFFGYCEALIDEIIELMECYNLVHLNFTKYEVNELNYKNAKIEAVDALHFLMSIFHILNMGNPKDFETEYIRINSDDDIFESYYNFIGNNSLKSNNHMIIYSHIINFLKAANRLKNRTNWKWWSKSVKEDPTSQFKKIIKIENIGDDCRITLMELMYIFYYLNFDLKDILDIYKEKCKINYERQKNNYDVKTKDEKDNLELEKRI